MIARILFLSIILTNVICEVSNEDLTVDIQPSIIIRNRVKRRENFRRRRYIEYNYIKLEDILGAAEDLPQGKEEENQVDDLKNVFEWSRRTKSNTSELSNNSKTFGTEVKFNESTEKIDNGSILNENFDETTRDYSDDRRRRNLNGLWQKDVEDSDKVSTEKPDDIWRWYLKGSANNIKNTDDDLLQWYLKTKGKDLPKDRNDNKKVPSDLTNTKHEYSKRDLNDFESIKLPVLIEGNPVDDTEFEKEDEQDDSKNVEDTLLLANVIFRHGDTKADEDPHNMFDYYPVGMGQLTDSGKLRGYVIGARLRQRYGKFLGDLYYPGLVEARSTDFSSTKMSMELVLATLFPAGPNDVIQDVPYNYVPLDQEKMLVPFGCSNYFTEFSRVTASPKIQNIYRKHTKIFEIVSNETGLNVTSIYEIYKLYSLLKAQKDFGLELPDWTRDLFPEVFEKLAVIYFYELTGTYELQRILAGAFLEKVIKDCEAQLSITEDHFRRKMYLYAGHDFNIASILISLGIFDDEIPSFGSYVVLEYHIKNNVPALKILYDNWNIEGPKVLRIPGCGVYCPLSKFRLLVSNVLPINGDSDCQ